jgi:hypothetical protein
MNRTVTLPTVLALYTMEMVSVPAAWVEPLQHQHYLSALGGQYALVQRPSPRLVCHWAVPRLFPFLLKVSTRLWAARVPAYPRAVPSIKPLSVMSASLPLMEVLPRSQEQRQWQRQLLHGPRGQALRRVRREQWLRLVLSEGQHDWAHYF